MDRFDLSQLRLDSSPNGKSKKALPRHQHWKGFLRGPIPDAWLGTAAKLPGKAGMLGVALWREAGFQRDRTVVLTRKVRDRYAVGEGAARRGLRALEAAGLVAVERGVGRAPRVTILERSRP